MIKAENPNWHDMEHTPFNLPYIGLLVVRSLSCEDYSRLEQQIGVEFLVTPRTGVRHAEIDIDESMDWALFKLEFEAGSDLQAMRTISNLAIEAWMEAGKDPTDLGYVGAHLAYLPELEAARTERGIDINHKAFLADNLDLIYLDDEGEARQLEPSVIFYDTLGSVGYTEKLTRPADTDGL